jgi:hypothetical protein
MGRFAVAVVCALLASTSARAEEAPCRELATLEHLAAARSAEEGSGIAGSGRADEGSGIAGSGQSDVAVYGAITGFGSVCVNGLRVHYSDDLQVEQRGASAPAGELAVGHVVWIVGGAEAGRLVAREIEIASAVIGPVVDVEPDARRVKVLDVWVSVPDDARLVDSRGRTLELAGGLRVGDVVDVAGLPAPGPDAAIVATRIERLGEHVEWRKGTPLVARIEAVPALRALSLEGFVGARGAEVWSLGGLELQRGSGPAAVNAAIGQRVWALATRSDAGGFTLRQLEPPPLDPSPSLPEGAMPPPGVPPGSGATDPKSPGLGASDLPDLFAPDGVTGKPKTLRPRPGAIPGTPGQGVEIAPTEGIEPTRQPVVRDSVIDLAPVPAPDPVRTDVQPAGAVRTEP